MTLRTTSRRSASAKFRITAPPPAAVAAVRAAGTAAGDAVKRSDP